jgi:hypothetical protein
LYKIIIPLIIAILFLTNCDNQIQSDTEASDQPVEEVDGINGAIESVIIFAGLLGSTSEEFVGIDVSWNKKLVLLTLGSVDHCVAAVDISDLRAPSIFYRIGNTTTPSVNGKYCRSVKIIDDGTKFILPNFEKHLQLFSMGANPLDTSDWTSEQDMFFPTKQPKRLSQLVDTGSKLNFILSSVGGLLKMEQDKATGVFTLLNSGADAYDNTHSLTYQDAAYIDDQFIVASEAGNGQDIKVFDNSSALIKTIILTNPTSYMWSSATSEDQSRIAVGGKYLALLSYDSEESADVDKIQLKSELSLDSSMRHMEFTIYNGVNYLVGSFSDGSIRIYNVNDLTNPILVNNFDIEAFDSEAYDLKVYPEQDLVFVAGRKGKFAILNLYKLINP